MPWQIINLITISNSLAELAVILGAQWTGQAECSHTDWQERLARISSTTKCALFNHSNEAIRYSLFNFSSYSDWVSIPALAPGLIFSWGCNVGGARDRTSGLSGVSSYGLTEAASWMTAWSWENVLASKISRNNLSACTYGSGSGSLLPSSRSCPAVELHRSRWQHWQVTDNALILTYPVLSCIIRCNIRWLILASKIFGFFYPWINPDFSRLIRFILSSKIF